MKIENPPSDTYANFKAETQEAITYIQSTKCSHVTKVS